MGRVYKPSANLQFNKRKQEDKYKTNWSLIREVRLIDENGDMVGIVPTNMALRQAEEAGLDLINISPNAVPPVCKICDYGKYKYEQQKKQKGNNKKEKKNKEIQYSINIDKNDLEIKKKKAIEFLQDNSIVLLVMKLKGRDMPRVNIAMELMKKICEDLRPYTKFIEEPKLTGRKIVATCK